MTGTVTHRNETSAALFLNLAPLRVRCRQVAFGTSDTKFGCLSLHNICMSFVTQGDGRDFRHTLCAVESLRIVNAMSNAFPNFATPGLYVVLWLPPRGA